MKIVIIAGSHRKDSESSRVAQYIEKELTKNQSVQASVLDLRQNPLPLWEEGIWSGDKELSALWAPFSRELEQADAFVVISPEWSGMVPAGLKNFFLYCSRELAHKPALIVSISASRGGTYPVAELRMSSYKNTRLLYIPEQVIITQVGDMLHEKPESEISKADSYVRERLGFALALLAEYGQALSPIRTLELWKDRPEKFQHGM